MTILDEDIPEDQRQFLRSWRLPVRRIGVEVGKRGWCHSGYCLVHLNVKKEEAAEFIRRTLRHQELNARGKRTGAVLRVQPGGISLWRISAKHVAHLSWKD